MGIAINNMKMDKYNNDTIIDLREEVYAREFAYQKALRKELFDKFKYSCISIIPSLIRAIFDPTVREITLNIIRPEDSVLQNNCSESKSGKLKVRSNNMMQKAIYFEELYKKWN